MLFFRVLRFDKSCVPGCALWQVNLENLTKREEKDLFKQYVCGLIYIASEPVFSESENSGEVFLKF